MSCYQAHVSRLEEKCPPGGVQPQTSAEKRNDSTSSAIGLLWAAAPTGRPAAAIVTEQDDRACRLARHAQQWSSSRAFMLPRPNL